MKISIVIPVYNVEKYLTECIESVLCQNFDDFEIILVNDGSTDSSGMICEAYTKQYQDKIKLIQQSNSGLLLARRVGFGVATGEVVMSLDSDDKLRQGALRRINEVFSEYKVDLVLFKYSRKENFSSAGVEPPFNESRYFDTSNIEELRYRLCSSSTLNPMWIKAIRREFIGSDFDYSKYAGLSYGEDLLQSLPVFDSISSAYYINESLYYYRVNYSSLTKRFTDEQVRSRGIVRREQMRYAEKWARVHDNWSLLSGAKGLCITSFAELAQSASESLNWQEALAVVKVISNKDEFRNIYNDMSARKKVRKDFQIISFLMFNRLYKPIIVICRTKGKLRKMLGR